MNETSLKYIPVLTGAFALFYAGCDWQPSDGSALDDNGMVQDRGPGRGPGRGDDDGGGDGDRGDGDGANNGGLVATPAAPAVRDALFDLGQALAFDPVLSGNRDIACLTCHHPEVGTDDDRVLPAGAGASGLGEGRSPEPVVHRNAPALFNLHAMDTMFWDNRLRQLPNGGFASPAGDQLTEEMVDTFEYGLVSAQAMFPVTSREEMRGEVGENELATFADDDFTGIWSALMTRLGAIPAYRDLFEAAYPGETFEEMTFAHAANAIAGFEIAAFESRGSRVERFLRGEIDLNDDELDGLQAFQRDGCTRCHLGVGGSDFNTHNTGVPQLGPGMGHGPSGREDHGASAVTGSGDDQFAFRTTPLWNVTLTAPYGHSGAFHDLEEFVGHYQNAGAQLLDYEPSDHLADPFFDDLHFTGTDAQIAVRLSPLLGNGNVDEDAIVVFLAAWEDPDASELGWTVPDRVPSGLPIDAP